MKNEKPPCHFLFRVLYWVLGVSLVILIVTGVGLHAVARPGWPLLGRVSAKTIESLVLTAEKTKRSPESVEALRTLDWAVSMPRKIDLNNGVGFSNGATTLDLRAIYDDHFLYVRAQWVDPGDSIPFCVSAFDHAAKRHAYHLAVYTLYLKPPAE